MYSFHSHEPLLCLPLFLFIVISFLLTCPRYDIAVYVFFFFICVALLLTILKAPISIRILLNISFVEVWHSTAISCFTFPKEEKSQLFRFLLFTSLLFSHSDGVGFDFVSISILWNLCKFYHIKNSFRYKVFLFFFFFFSIGFLLLFVLTVVCFYLCLSRI